MERVRVSILAGFFLFAVAACSDNPNDVRRLNGARGTVVTSTQTLDQSIRELLALFPRNLDQRDPDSEGPDLNPRATWDQIKKKYATGLSNAAHMVIAKRKLVRLSDWAARNAQMMSPPPNLETKTAASARLVLYMNMYVYGGPNGTPPDFIPGADVAVGVVTPGAPATIVTPTKHAGVQFEAGSVDENTVVVVIQNPTVFSANCSGPLDTKFCQYPQFYTFDQFPHKALLKPAKFNVCHVTGEGGPRNPGGIHDRLRLAHPKPAISTDYTPGSTIRDEIEILPLVPQTFSTCEASSYLIGLDDAGLISRLARGIRKIVSPKTAYAIDLGLGGLSKSFSAFNDVDSIGRPDIAVQSFDVPAGPVQAGNHFAAAYSVTNIGKATNAAVPFAIRLRFPIAGGLFSSVEIGGGTLPSLAPGATHGEVNVDAVIPATLASGSYMVRFIVASDPTFPDANLADNEFAATVTVGPTLGFTDLGVLAGDLSSWGTGINDAGHVVGTSFLGEGARPFIWIDGVMTSLGSLGGTYGRAAAINNSDQVVGISRIASGADRAFRWQNGVMTNLGTLEGADQSEATGINSDGVVIGFSVTNFRPRAWRWDGEIMTELVTPPEFISAVPLGINDAGQIVGYSETQTGWRAWIWQNGTMTSLSNPEGGAIPFAINNSGTIVGFTLPDPPIGGVYRAVRWVDGSRTDIGSLPGHQSSSAADISDNGRIVGNSFSGTAASATLWQNGQVIELPTPVSSSGPNGINANGKIVGTSRLTGGANHAVLWQAPPLQ